MDAVRRPSAKEYQQALDLYRTNAGPEAIADALGWNEATVEQLIEVGWPASDDGPALMRLRSAIRDRLTRVRAAELDVIQQHAETAGKTAPVRARTIEAAAQIENAIMSAWGRHTVELMREDSKATAADLCMPKVVLDNLRALRSAQVAEVEARSVEIFARSASRGPDEGESSLEDQIYGDLAEMTPEEQAEYSRTGRKPSRQQELPFTETDA
jgi:hypothetical protein